MAVTYEQKPGQKPMPRYQSSGGEQVHALKIRLVGELLGGAALVPEDDSYGEVTADVGWMEQNAPQVGGYVVRYDDGRWSYSPADAFESDYKLVAG